MKIILFSIGTRGDMEPFLTIGEILMKKGHRVICAFPSQFQSLAEQSGLDFTPLGPECLDILESKAARKAFGGSSSKTVRKWSAIKMAVKYIRIRKAVTIREFEILNAEQPDCVLHNALNVYPFIWGFKNKNKSILVSAIPFIIHSAKQYPYIMFSRDFGPVLNKITYLTSNWGLSYHIQKGFRHLNLPEKPSLRKILDSFLGIKMVFTISPYLFPRPADWKDNVQILGFHERDKRMNWTPPDDLEHFLESHHKILFITFGSIANSNPEEKTRIILNVLEAHNIPAIINTASGGLVVPPEYNADLFYFVSQIPYDWILPRIYAIVHHGGSGTTHTGLKCGCPTLIIPHIFDQFTWNKIISENGFGPKGNRITEISEKNLMPLILDLYTNISYKKRAEEVSRKMKGENLEEDLYRFIME